ncbi:MAG: HEAT repeat domain-containing protein [Acidobacteria bacterium]|nr:HEAT repeat domain-containing protein [Acidobacteriota bacterium]
METDLQRLVASFAQNPAWAGRRMRQMQAADPGGFTASAVPVLNRLGEDQPAGGDYLITLLLSCGHLPGALADPAQFHLETAIRVARAASRIDPQVGVSLAQRMASIGSPDGIAESRLLEILEAVRPIRGILPMIARLTTHPNLRVRAKAVLLTGRGNRNPHWIAQQLTQEDARVRANAVEALWGLDTPDARAVLWQAGRDAHHRVLGNALLGLHRLGDAGVVPRILSMARHESPLFRAAAAWVMGESGDPRFLDPLTAAAGDSDARVRQSAAPAVACLQQAAGRTAARGRQRVHISQVRPLAGHGRTLHLVVAAEGGGLLDELPATSFLVREDSRPVELFRVERLRRADSLAFAIAMPRSQEIESWRKPVQEAALACLKLKRKADSWAVVKYSPGVDLKPAMDPVRPLSDAAVVERWIRDPGDRALSPSGALDALDLLLASLPRVRGSRAAVLIADTGGGAGALTMEAYHHRLEQLPRQARAARIVIHGILPPKSSALVESGLRTICAATGGLLLRVDSPDGLPDALARLYFSSLERLEIVYRPAGETTESVTPSQIRVQVFCDSGYGEDSFPPAGSAA